MQNKIYELHFFGKDHKLQSVKVSQIKKWKNKESGKIQREEERRNHAREPCLI